MAKALILAIALVLLVEGILPFAAPRAWREMFRRIMEMTDGQIRFFGLSSLLIGLILLFFAR